MSSVNQFSIHTFYDPYATRVQTAGELKLLLIIIFSNDLRLCLN
jgi:hypothetical protein